MPSRTSRTSRTTSHRRRSSSRCRRFAVSVRRGSHRTRRARTRSNASPRRDPCTDSPPRSAPGSRSSTASPDASCARPACSRCPTGWVHRLPYPSEGEIEIWSEPPATDEPELGLPTRCESEADCRFARPGCARVSHETTLERSRASRRVAPTGQRHPGPAHVASRSTRSTPCGGTQTSAPNVGCIERRGRQPAGPWADRTA